MRIAAALLSILFLASTVAAATGHDPTAWSNDVQTWPSMKAAQRLLADAQRFGLSIGPAATQQPENGSQQPSSLVSAGGLDLHPLGDIDGDGHADVAAIQTYYPRPETTDAPSGLVQALRGPDLTQVAWSLPLKGSDAVGTLDVDGDGHQDLVVDAWPTYTGTGQSAGAAVASAQTGSSDELSSRRFIDAKTGTARLTVDQTDHEDYTVADAFALAAFGYAMHGVDAGVTVDPLGNGTFLRTKETSSRNDVYAAAVEGVFAYGGGRTATLEFLDAAGTLRGTVAVDGPIDNLVGLMPGQLDAKPGRDLVITVAEDPTPYTVAAVTSVPLAEKAAATRIEAIAGSDGQVLWTKRYEASPAYERAVAGFAVGDADGDGIDDVEVVDLRIVTPVTLQEHVDILSGSSGSVLTSKDLQDSLIIGLPFGDADGDGKADLLGILLNVDLVTQTSTESLAAIRASDFSNLWTYQMDASSPAYLVNGRISTIGNSLAGLTDWTGDGRTDVVLSNRPETPWGDMDGAADLRVLLLDGKTGSSVRDTTYPGTYQYLVLDDVTGSGEQDVVIVAAPGLSSMDTADFSGLTVTATLLAGETGATLATATLRSGDAGLAFATYEARNLGDLDGAGGPEWGLHAIDMPRNPHDYSQYGDNDPVEHWLLFPGTPGAQVVSLAATPEGPLSSEPANATALGPGGSDPGGAVGPSGTPGHGPDGAAAQPAHKSPGPEAIVAGLALLGCVALFRRRW